MSVRKEMKKKHAWLNKISLWKGVVKALRDLRVGEFKGLEDLVLDVGDEQLKSWLKDKALKSKIELIQAEVIEAIEDNLSQNVAEERFEFIVEHALQAFSESFSLDSLLQAHVNPSSVERWGSSASKALEGSTDGEHQLYRTVLQSTVRALIGQISDLPGYHTWLIENLGGLHLKVGTLGGIVKKYLGDKARQDFEFELEYREELRDQLDVVQLFIEHTPIDSAAKRQKLQAAYVKVQLASGSAEGASSVNISAPDLLNGQNGQTTRIVLLGRAGSGKTTLLRWLGLQTLPEINRTGSDLLQAQQPGSFEPLWEMVSRLATGLTGLKFNTYTKKEILTNTVEETLRSANILDTPTSKSVGTWRSKIPFFIRLRDLSAGPWPTPNGFLCSVNTKSDMPEGWAQRLLSLGRGLVLIDGLDELAQDRRESAVEWIRNQLCKHHEDNIIVVSSRPQAVESGVLSDVGFEEYAIHDLGFDARIECAEAWHRAVSIERTGSPELDERLTVARDRIVARLREDTAVQRMASNPLLCALMCALNRSSDGELPNSLGKLCELTVQMLLWDRDNLQTAVKSSIPREYEKTSRGDRQRVVRDLARESLLSPDSDLVQRRHALETIADTLHRDIAESEPELNEILSGLILRSNLVQEAREDDIEFSHNSVRDHLVASYVVRKFTPEELVEKVRSHERARWTPILMFATLEKNREDYAYDVLRILFQDNFKAFGFQDWRIALDLVRELGISLPADIKTQVKGVFDTIADVALTGVLDGPSTPSQAKLIGLLGKEGLPMLSYKEGMSEGTMVACVNVLGEINSPDSSTKIVEYLSHSDSVDVLEAACQALGYEEFSKHCNVLSLPSVRRDISGSAELGTAYRRFVHDLTPLSKSKRLISLSLSDSSVVDLSPLKRKYGLRLLFLSRSLVTDVSPLKGLKGLILLDLSETPVVDPSHLATLVNLASLDISGTQIVDFAFLEHLRSLIHLDISNTGCDDLSPLGNHPLLSALIAKNTPIYNIRDLHAIQSLAQIDISRTQVSDLSPLEGLSRLKSLDLSRTRVTSLSPLRDAQALESISLNETAVTDLSPLHGLPKLRTVSVDEIAVRPEEISALLRANPEVEVHFS